ncbi:MAG: SDR family oxidoreductase [Oscillospiraceae bacterium]|nr:SDR family oxidoreductase [Oscillospiraceae bacterium]
MPRVVLITGASSGLGKAIAEAFAGKGDTVYGTSRGQFEHPLFHTLTLDVDDTGSCQAAVGEVIRREGRLDVLVNNAGFGIGGALELTGDDEMLAQFQTNFFGALRMSRAVLPVMRQQGRGRIIQISSAAAAIPIPFQALYAASKAALECASQALAMEVKPFHIKVSCVQFGDMKTGFTGSRRMVAGCEGDSVYREKSDRSVARMEKDEQNGPTPEKAAKLVLKVAGKRRPKALYTKGIFYKAVVLARRVLPLRFSNWLIGKLYG